MSSETFSYPELYNAWKEELLAKKLTPLNLNFIQNTLFSLESLKHTNNNPVELVLVKRADFLIKNLIELRKHKLIEIIINKQNIDSSYLSKQELLFYDFIKNSENILQNKLLSFSDQLANFLDKNSNLSKKDSSKNEEQKEKDYNKEEDNIDETITVIFQKDIEKFIYVDKKNYGPFKINDIASIPIEIYNKILLPKQIAKEK